jgi:membrane protein required for beta-lactamase induction
MVIPGLEERVTYQIESSVCGTRIHCSVLLRGWLAPLVWSLIRKPAARVAYQLAIAAENPWRRLPGKPKDKTCFDF